MSEVTEASVRAEVRAWLEANWNPELGLVEWRNKLADSGWGVPHWPRDWYGRDLPMARSYSTHWFFPRDFASYIARSALRSMLSAVSLLSPNATPMLADRERWWPATWAPRESATRIRSQAELTSGGWTSSSSSANSSPPSRATVSEPRSVSIKRRPSSTSSSSPAA